jgi:hypothetical protein
MNSPDNQHLAQKKASDIDTVLAAELNNLPEYLKEIPKIIIEYFYRRFGFQPSKPEGWVISNRTGMNEYLIKVGSRNNYGNPQEIRRNKDGGYIGHEDNYNEQIEFEEDSNFFEIEIIDLAKITRFVNLGNALQAQGITGFSNLLRYKKYMDNWPKGDTNVYCMARRANSNNNV